MLKDYTYEMKKLQDSINDAKINYIENLGEIEPDIQRIDCLKNDLKHMFYFRKKTAKVIEKSIFSVLVPNNQQNMMANNESKYENPPQAASRTRKSFFNFGNWLQTFLIMVIMWYDISYILFYWFKTKKLKENSWLIDIDR